MQLEQVRAVSRAIHQAHRFVYFAPEMFEEAALLGVDERDRTYFASRSAALGAVPWQVTHAVFYNFSATAVRVVDGVWDLAPPEVWQAARHTAVDRAVRRVGATLPQETVVEARAILDPVIAAADFGGKPLAAANLAVPLPNDPTTALWQQLTVLREWRGYAHVSVLAANDVGPCDCNLLQAATGRFPALEVARMTRRWSDSDWDDAQARLHARGWLAEDGTATPAGMQARERIEVETDERCAALWEGADPSDAERLAAAIAPIDAAFTAARTFG